MRTYLSIFTKVAEMMMRPTFLILTVVTLLGLMTSGFSYSASTCFYGNCENGFSIKKSSKGVIVVGEYKSDILEGEGRFIDRDGDQCAGIWKEGKMAGEVSCRYKSGSVFVGDYVNGKKNGGGIFFNGDGSVNKEGVWVKGKFSYDIQTIYHGRENLFSDTVAENFKDCLVGDCINGWGIKLAFGGALQKGDWENGEFKREVKSISNKNDDIDTNRSSRSINFTDRKSKFVTELVTINPDVFDILGTPKFKEFIKSKVSINTLFKEGFKARDAEKVRVLLKMYTNQQLKRTVITKPDSSPNAQTADLVRLPTTKGLNSESQLGIPVQYRNNGKTSYDNASYGLFFVLVLILGGLLIRTYF